MPHRPHVAIVVCRHSHLLPTPYPTSAYCCRVTQTRYMELCGVTNKPYRESESALKSILTKYDTLEGNRLTLEGFLSYYRDIAVTDPRQVKTK